METLYDIKEPPVLAMLCNSTGTIVPPRSNPVFSCIRNLRRSIRERSAYKLGAAVATKAWYRALLQHYSGGEILLVARADHSANLKKELDHLRLRQGIYFKARIVEPAAVKNLGSASRIRWFDPGGIRPELFDFRHSYLKRVVPITFTHHTLSYRKQLSDTFLPLLLSKTLPCDSIVCSSNAAREALRKLLALVESRLPTASRLYRGRLDVIPFGIATDDFVSLDKILCRRVFNLPKDALIFLCLGRISAADKADLMPLLTAFSEARVRAGRRKLLLVIAGEARGPYPALLQERVREMGLTESVKFIRYLADSEKRFLFGASDVIVSVADSIQESFGVVLLEGMACGLPQVVSDWNGYRDLVENGRTGFLIPTIWAECDAEVIRRGTAYPDNWVLDHFTQAQSTAVELDSLVTALTELALNDNLRQEMSIASRRRAQGTFDWRIIVSQYEELWAELDLIAATIPTEGFHGESYRVPAYFKCFQHYASRTIDLSARVELRRSLPEVLRTITNGYPELLEGVVPFASWELDGLLDQLRRVGSAITVGDLVGHGCSRDEHQQRLAQVMWLVKQGLIKEADGLGTSGREVLDSVYSVSDSEVVR